MVIVLFQQVEDLRQQKKASLGRKLPEEEHPKNGVKLWKT